VKFQDNVERDCQLVSVTAGGARGPERWLGRKISADLGTEVNPWIGHNVETYRYFAIIRGMTRPGAVFVLKPFRRACSNRAFCSHERRAPFLQGSRYRFHKRASPICPILPKIGRFRAL
jgi:hypothetical protein